MKKIIILIPVFLFLINSPKCQISAEFKSNPLHQSDFTYRFEPLFMDSLSFTYHWDFGDGSRAVGPIVSHTFADHGEYMITLTVTDGNISRTMIRPLRAPANFEITNVFTPNDDGYNDLFVIHTDGLSKYTLTVYSRTGTMVHRSTSVTPVWDGRTPAGEYVHPGIYYYVVRSGTESGEFETSGFVHLIREPVKK
jgi:gliding motility-associated-like protein